MGICQSLPSNERGGNHKEAHQDRSTHESTDLWLHADRNELPPGRRGNLQDAEEKKTLQGNGRRLRMAHMYSDPPVFHRNVTNLSHAVCVLHWFDGARCKRKELFDARQI